MKRLAEMLTGLLIRNCVIEESEKEIYHYGFQITMANAINLLIALCIGYLTCRLWNVTLFYLLFMVNRRYAGGYHADSYGKCFTTFAICVVLMLAFSEFMLMIKGYWLLIGSNTFVIYIVTMWWFTPCPNEHVTLSSDEQSQYRNVCRGILLITGCASVLLYGGGYHREVSVILVTILEVMVLFWLGNRNHEQK